MKSRKVIQFHNPRVDPPRNSSITPQRLIQTVTPRIVQEEIPSPIRSPVRETPKKKKAPRQNRIFLNGDPEVINQSAQQSAVQMMNNGQKIQQAPIVQPVMNQAPIVQPVMNQAPIVQPVMNQAPVTNHQSKETVPEAPCKNQEFVQMVQESQCQNGQVFQVVQPCQNNPVIQVVQEPQCKNQPVVNGPPCQNIQVVNQQPVIQVCQNQEILQMVEQCKVDNTITLRIINVMYKAECKDQFQYIAEFISLACHTPGWDINEVATFPSGAKSTILEMAVMRHWPEMVQLVLKMGANPNISSTEETLLTQLLSKSVESHKVHDIICMLIEAGGGLTKCKKGFLAVQNWSHGTQPHFI